MQREALTNTSWLVVGPPLWKTGKSIGMMTFPIYGKIKNGNQTTNQLHWYLGFQKVHMNIHKWSQENISALLPSILHEISTNILQWSAVQVVPKPHKTQPISLPVFNDHPWYPYIFSGNFTFLFGGWINHHLSPVSAYLWWTCINKITPPGFFAVESQWNPILSGLVYGKFDRKQIHVLWHQNTWFPAKTFP